MSKQKDTTENLGSSRCYASPGCPICPVCGVPSLAVRDGDLCIGCGADIFEMAERNRIESLERLAAKRWLAARKKDSHRVS
jgi:hypothetical protein